MKRVAGQAPVRAITAIVMIAVYVVASFGIMPSPAVVARWFSLTSTQQPYPCESCGCGCASAKECWSNCCCHTPVQRLSWAIRRGVMPPSEVQFSDDQWIAAANRVRSGSAHCSLCVNALKDRLTRGERVTPGDTRAEVRDEPAASCCSSGTAEDAPQDLPQATALKCKGASAMLLLAVQPSLAQVFGLSMRLAEQPGRVLLADHPMPGAIERDVAVPPPRV